MKAIELDKKLFEQMINSSKPVLVDFWAPWCGYCRRISPAYEKIAEEYKEVLETAKVNIDDHPQIAGSEEIEVIPTLVLYQNGKVIDSVVAPESKAMIDRFLRRALEKEGGI